MKEEGSLLPISEEEDADENSSIGSGASSWPLTDDEEEHSSSELVPTISACSMHIQRLTATIIPPNTANPQMPVDTTSAMKIYINDSIDRSVLVARLKAASAKLKRDVEIQSAFTFRPTTLTVQGKPTIPSIQIQPPTPEQSAPSPDAISRRPMITNNRALQRQRTFYIALKALELPEKLQKLDAFPVLVGPLPKGWERRELDMGQGKLVPGFASVSTKTVTRIMPGTPDPFDAFVFTDEKGHLGFGWEKTKSFDGSVCYVNHLSREAQKKRPESDLDSCVVPQKDIITVLRELKADADPQGRKLPDLWSRQVGRFGIPFYVNRAQKVVTLKNPLNFTPLHLQILNTLPEQVSSTRSIPSCKTQI